VALAIGDFSPQKGGAERSVAEIAEDFLHSGHEVHVFAYRFGDSVEGRLQRHKVPVIPFPKSLRLLSFALMASRAMRRGGFDLTISVGETWGADVLQSRGGVHWSWFWKSLRAYRNPLLRGVKLLGRLLSPKQWAQGLIETIAYKKAKRIIAISEMVKEDIVRYYKIPPDRIEVSYTKVDIERFHPRNRRWRADIRARYGIPQDAFLILFSSHNFRMKGLRYLIEALSILKDSGKYYYLLVLGRDDPGPYLRLAKKLGCEERIRFAGEVRDPERYYGAADLLVHPTFYDACSRVVLEALSSGLPVITTRSNGAGWVLLNGEGGMLLEDPFDANNLSEKIRLFFDVKIQEETEATARSIILKIYKQL